MIGEGRLRWPMLVLGGFFCVLALAVVVFGAHHVDEGYYHLIARLTAEGRLPYRDYLYVQTPLYPLVYGMLFRVFGSSLLMARGYSAFFSLLTFLMAVRIARTQRGDAAAVITAGLILCQPYTLYYMGIIKLYAMSGLLLTGVIFCLTRSFRPGVRYPLAVAVAALAVATRLTLLPAVPVIVLLAFCRSPRHTRWRIAAFTAGTGLAVLAAMIGPFVWFSSDTFWYSVVGYHLDKESYSLIRQILHKADVISRLCRLYGLIIAAMGTVLITHVQDRFADRHRPLDDLRKTSPSIGTGDAFWVLASIITFHFTSQEPYIHRYLAMTIPAIAAVLGPEIDRLADRLPRAAFPVPASVGGMVLILVFVGAGQSKLIWKPNPVTYLKAVAMEIGAVTGAGDEILTFNNSIAVEADRNVLPGDEMNVLTYDTEWDRNRCGQFHVLNVEMLEDAICTSRLRAILITRYSFIGNFPTFYNPGEIGARPRIMASIEKHYHRINTFPGFGYLGEDAELYLPLMRKPVTGDAGSESEPAVQIYKYEYSGAMR
ncbi:glycosyltransferase family 39 protein [bacterium]|nr:glycosyltransferase family 39 protein [candidate division CSSED10-310 bacterium]